MIASLRGGGVAPLRLRLRRRGVSLRAPQDPAEEPDQDEHPDAARDQQGEVAPSLGRQRRGRPRGRGLPDHDVLRLRAGRLVGGDLGRQAGVLAGLGHGVAQAAVVVPGVEGVGDRLRERFDPVAGEGALGRAAGLDPDLVLSLGDQDEQAVFVQGLGLGEGALLDRLAVPQRVDGPDGDLPAAPAAEVLERSVGLAHRVGREHPGPVLDADVGRLRRGRPAAEESDQGQADRYESPHRGTSVGAGFGPASRPGRRAPVARVSTRSGP